MLETIADAGIHFPAVMSIFVAICETLFGLFLAAGLLTRISALVLMIISLAALFTVELSQISGGIKISWYSWLLDLPQSGYVLMCVMLIVQGCGPYGIDRAIYRRIAG